MWWARIEPKMFWWNLHALHIELPRNSNNQANNWIGYSSQSGHVPCQCTHKAVTCPVSVRHVPCQVKLEMTRKVRRWSPFRSEKYEMQRNTKSDLCILRFSRKKSRRGLACILEWSFEGWISSPLGHTVFGYAIVAFSIYNKV